MCVVMTSPSVTFHVYYKDRTEPASISAAEDFPSEAGLANVREFREPLVKATIIVPASAIGPVSQLCAVRARGPPLTSAGRTGERAGSGLSRGRSGQDVRLSAAD